MKNYLFSTLTSMEHEERQQLRNQAKAAETPVQIKVAKAALKSWQAEHPDDLETSRLLEQLSLREAWLRINGEWH